MSDPHKICPQCRRIQPLSAALCVHCGRRFQTTAPHRPMPEDRTIIAIPQVARKSFPWVPVLLLTLPLLLCSPCLVAAFRVAISPTVQRPEPDLSKVRLFMSRQQVKSLLGEPDSVQTFQRPGGEDAYWYYGRHQLVFESNWLQSINSY